LVEGAGGLLVPLTRDVHFGDLARLLGARVVVVVGSRLGAINHALLTFEALARRDVPIVGYVVNRLGPDDDLAVATNEPLLATLTCLPCLDSLPWLAEEPARILAALRSGAPADAAARARLAMLGERLAEAVR